MTQEEGGKSESTRSQALTKTEEGGDKGRWNEAAEMKEGDFRGKRQPERRSSVEEHSCEDTSKELKVQVNKEAGKCWVWTVKK